ncbi:STAS domain-containing protein [Shewanella maritima]|uniref:STAS domain-containing protein n=1 Tax=Shewanella maritima TaxID=2520507 RepID=A0A411PG35_9GAMM|nr:STAS domain-containing protein [Shewanella maritima]QBF82448.1 STAS domain-containing protein [Shewanella maritima]
MAQFQQQNQSVYVSGHLTQRDVTQLWSRRDQLFTREAQVVDLSALEYTDSAGIALLLSLKSPTAGSQALKLVSPSPQLQKMIALYDLGDFFE